MQWDVTARNKEYPEKRVVIFSSDQYNEIVKKILKEETAGKYFSLDISERKK